MGKIGFVEFWMFFWVGVVVDRLWNVLKIWLKKTPRQGIEP